LGTRLRCLLLDDELPGLTYLRMLCEQLPGLEVVRAFNDPVRFLEESKSIDFDLCILDIEMPGLSGLELAQLLPGKQVIFTTAYKEYAAEAFDLEVVDYIRKPVQKSRLEKAVQKAFAKRRSSAERQFVQLNTSQGKALLFFDQLLLITASGTDSRDKKAVLENGRELTLKNVSLDALLSFLPKESFCRINRKEIVALKTVIFFTHGEISTSIKSADGKGAKLVLGEIYRQDFLQRTAL
jgi:two-component system LytT family response regulator